MQHWRPDELGQDGTANPERFVVFKISIDAVSTIGSAIRVSTVGKYSLNVIKLRQEAALGRLFCRNRFFDGSLQLVSGKRLLDNDRSRREGPCPMSIARDEKVRHKTPNKYFRDRSDTAPFIQTLIDNHQIGEVAGGRYYRIFLSIDDCAHLMTHLREQLLEEHRDHCVILRNQNSQRFDRGLVLSWDWTDTKFLGHHLP